MVLQVLKGFLNGIIGDGGSTTAAQQVNLKIRTEIRFPGEEITQTTLYDNVFNIPGTISTNNPGATHQMYNSPLGVFYISNIPVLKIAREVYSNSFPGTIDGARKYFDLDEM